MVNFKRINFVRREQGYTQPPSSLTADLSLIELDVSLSKIGNLINANSVNLGGDFNAPNIKFSWGSNQVLDHLATSERLMELANEYDLEPLVKEPTRIKGNTRNILDLVFTNNNTTVNTVKITPGISDHDIVFFTVNLAPKKKHLAKRKIYIRKRTDQEKLNQQLRSFAAQFESSSTNMSVDGKWKVFVQTITSIMDDSIPHKLSRSRSNLRWFNRSLRKQTRKKQRLYNKAKK